MRQPKKLHETGQVGAQSVLAEGAQLLRDVQVDPPGGLVRQPADRLQSVQQLVLVDGDGFWNFKVFFFSRLSMTKY